MLRHKQARAGGRNHYLPLAEPPVPLSQLRAEVVNSSLHHPAGHRSLGKPVGTQHDLFRRYAGTFGETMSRDLGWPFEARSFWRKIQDERTARQELYRTNAVEPFEFRDAVIGAHDKVSDDEALGIVQTRLRSLVCGLEVCLDSDDNLRRETAKGVLKLMAWEDVIKEQAILHTVDVDVYVGVGGS